MLDRLVVGYDGSEGATEAVAWAADEAMLRGAALEIVSSYPIVVPVESPAAVAMAARGADAYRESCEARLEQIAARTAALHPALKIEQTATVETPVAALVGASERADLVVVGNVGHGAVHSLLLGSVAHAVSRRSACPVAIIRHRTERPRGVVVVGVDGSPASDVALQWAIDEADLRRAALRIVHAWEPMYDEMTMGSPQSREISEIDAALTLERAVERAIERAGCTVQPVLVKDIATHALGEASEDAELLVIGSRGRGEIRSLLFGSVAHAVTQTVTCPVVVTRSVTDA